MAISYCPEIHEKRLPAACGTRSKMRAYICLRHSEVKTAFERFHRSSRLDSLGRGLPTVYCGWLIVIRYMINVNGRDTAKQIYLRAGGDTKL